LQMDRFRKAPEEQWMVPRLSWTGGVGTANPTVMTPRGTNPAILPRNSMPGRLGQEVAGVKPDDLKATPGSLPSKGSPSKQELKAQQKQRLDKLLEFASKENDRLNRLIEESQGDAQQESVQVTKLLESKKNTERLFQDVVKQRDALETALKSAEAERDVAMAQSKVLTVEREELEGQVAKAALENERLQCVVADTLAEKERLEGIAREKAEVERQLAEAKAFAEELEERAKRAERVEKIMKTGEAERARLESLVTANAEEKEAVQKQQVALDAKVAEVTKHNNQLQAQLQHRGKVEEAVKQLE